MDYFDLYKQRLNKNNLDIKQKMIENNKKMNDALFDVSPTLKIVKVNEVETTARVTSVAVYQSSLFVTTSNYKKVIFKDIDLPLYMGDIISYDDTYWIVIDITKTELSLSCVVVKCNSKLKYYYNNQIVELYTHISKDRFMLKEDKVMIVPDKTYRSFVQYNNITKTFSEGLRFVINADAYKISQLDRISRITNDKGVLEVTFDNDIVQEKDDIINGIAFNGSEVTTQLAISGSDTIRLNSTQTYTIDTQNIFAWSINNTSIATIISQTGNSCTIKAIGLGEIELTAIYNQTELKKKIKLIKVF